MIHVKPIVFWIWLGALALFSWIPLFLLKITPLYYKYKYNPKKIQKIIEDECKKNGHEVILIPASDWTPDLPTGQYVCKKCNKVTGGVGKVQVTYIKCENGIGTKTSLSGGSGGTLGG